MNERIPDTITVLPSMNPKSRDEIPSINFKSDGKGQVEFKVSGNLSDAAYTLINDNLQQIVDLQRAEASQKYSVEIKRDKNIDALLVGFGAIFLSCIVMVTYAFVSSLSPRVNEVSPPKMPTSSPAGEFKPENTNNPVPQYPPTPKQ